MCPGKVRGEQGLSSLGNQRNRRSPHPANTKPLPGTGKAHLSWFWKKSFFSKHSYTQPGAKRAAENPCFRISSSDWGDSSRGGKVEPG